MNIETKAQELAQIWCDLMSDDYRWGATYRANFESFTNEHRSLPEWGKIYERATQIFHGN